MREEVSRRRVGFFTSLTTASLLVAGVILFPGVGADGPRDYVVTFSQLPADREHYAGGKVEDTNEALRTLTVHAGDPRGFEQRVSHDPKVVSYEENAELFQPLWTPDDAYFQDSQYDLRAGTTNIQSAWDTTTGTTAVKVCVVDTGQYRSHSDLRDIAWGEWRDFVQAKPSAYDDLGHGTHVTGTIAAGLNNVKGVAGIARVTIAGAKVINQDGYGTVSALSNAITWCTDIGSDVINISLGGGWSQTLANAVHYATERDVLVVAAAGNRGPCESSCVLYPAALPDALAVGCTDQYNRRCSFSSQGPEIDLAAPGMSILSTTIPDCGSTSCYLRKSGTSMATPHVTGLAALVKSAHMDFSASQVRRALVESAKDLGVAGRDSDFGSGLIQGRAVI
jgi:subtilisin family serine protease